MKDIVYIVTSGCYSDYSIDAVFKDKAKAEFYCKCHTDCEIEEWNLSDGDTFTPFNHVSIIFSIRQDRDLRDNYFNFKCSAIEDSKFYLKNRDSVSVYAKDWIEIALHRRLPNNYDEEKIKAKYTKVFQDLRAEILYLVSELNLDSWENRKLAAKYIEEYIKGKFGIEE